MEEISILLHEPLPLCNFSSLAAHPQEHASIVWLTNSISLPLIALLGLLCNALNILILTTNRGARRMPSWNLLVALAFSDSLFLLFAVLETTPLGVPAVALWPALNQLYAHSALYIRALASTFYKSSILIVVAFNVERFVYVAWPLRASRLYSERTTRVAIVGSVLLSAACSLQWPLCYRIHVCLEPLRGVAVHSIAMSPNLALQQYYRTMDMLSMVAFTLLPIAALLILNCKLIVTLKKVADEDDSRRNEGALGKSEQTTSRSTANAMLFAVVIVLLICLGSQAPARLLFSSLGQYHPYAILYACISQQLVFLNASLNFALYCVVSRRYRDLMKATLLRLCDRAKGQGSASSPPRTRISKFAPNSSRDSDGHGMPSGVPLLPRASIVSNPETRPFPLVVPSERRESAPLVGLR